MKKTTSIITTLLTGAILWASGGIISAKISNESKLRRNLSTFNEIVTQLNLNFVDSVDADKILDASLSGLYNAYDPYTVYYNSDHQDELETITSGKYGGIGAYLSEYKGSTYIASPIKGSPADRAGIRAGDQIVRVDTIDVSRKGSNYVTSILRGSPSTSVDLVMKRPYTADSIYTVTLTREVLQRPSVTLSKVIGNTGYIAISTFIESTPEEVKVVFEGFKADPRVENIVIDLRSNGGGLVEPAIDLLGYFLPKGTKVLTIKRKETTAETTYKTTHQPLFPDMPLAIMIDGGSASASEVLAGAIQDLDRGILVGTRSFGKGLVQNTLPISTGGILKITTGKYYTPSGRLIQAIDYSNLNEDGSVRRIPDSLTREFKTLHGRTVRDGGGLAPDSVVNDSNLYNLLAYKIINNRSDFRFATQYLATHPDVASPDEFVLSDEAFEEFKKSIDPEDFKYERELVSSLKELQKAATDNGFDDPEIKAGFDNLARLLTRDLNQELDKNRRMVNFLVGSEIMEQKYYNEGRIEYMLRDDKELDVARSILNSDHYYKLLNITKR